MSLRQCFLALLLGVVGIQFGLGCAKAQPAYEIQLEDEFGNRLPVYSHRSEWFAQGREGQRYNVRVVNHTGRRIEAVVSVDGRDVLSGMPGDYKGQRGYLVPAYGSVLIDGFRTSMTEVAAFRFTSPGDSYSARMGTPENVGVIGAAIFREAPSEPVYRPQIPRRSYPNAHGGGPARHDSSNLGSGASESSRSRSAEAKSAPSAAPAAGAPYASSPADDYAERESNIGTEYGEQQYSAVSEVPFERAHPRTPERVITLRYDDYQGLVARGVLPRPAPRPVYHGPSAFPVNGFAPPPPPRSYWN
jgi:hypothetical protein